MCHCAGHPIQLGQLEDPSMKRRGHIGTFIQVGAALFSGMDNNPNFRRPVTTCRHCKGAGPKAGWIEQNNNGPIVPCPVCNPKADREIEYERAVAQRSLQEHRK
jgi:hypothetical protein